MEVIKEELTVEEEVSHEEEEGETRCVCGEIRRMTPDCISSVNNVLYGSMDHALGLLMVRIAM